MKSALSFVLSFLASYWHKMINMFVDTFIGERMLSGELSVVGRDTVEIKLGGHCPSRVEVEFVDECHEVPCNHHKNELKWELEEREHEHHRKEVYLVIKWHVSGLRAIRYTVHF